MYTPKTTAQAEARWREAWRGPKFATPIEVDIVFYDEGTSITVTPVVLDETPKLRADIDNLLKLALDALNGVAWNDDRQVVKVTAVKL